jgi:plastocyanin
MTLVLALLGVAGCASEGTTHTTTFRAAVDQTTGIQRVNMTAHAFYFDPNRVIVQAGHPVELRIDNTDHMLPHNFSISDPSLKVDVDMSAREIMLIRFTPQRPGEYEFYCDVGSHAKKGMTGTLVVE